MTKHEYTLKLRKYLLPGAADFAADLFWNENSLQLVINRSRKSKYGDYKCPQPNQPYHRISVNHDLEPNQLFVTLLHEYAHYQVYLSIKNQEPPHGEAWKNTFRMLLRKAIKEGAFPKKIEPIIIQCYFQRENIASGICKKFREATGDTQHETTVSDLPENSFFLLEQKTFRRGKKLRTRYECVEVKSNKTYRVHEDAVVDHVFTHEEIKKFNFHP